MFVRAERRSLVPSGSLAIETYRCGKEIWKGEGGDREKVASSVSRIFNSGAWDICSGFKEWTGEL